jgi:hypothetical protein
VHRGWDGEGLGASLPLVKEDDTKCWKDSLTQHAGSSSRQRGWRGREVGVVIQWRDVNRGAEAIGRGEADAMEAVEWDGEERNNPSLSIYTIKSDDTYARLLNGKMGTQVQI